MKQESDFASSVVSTEGFLCARIPSISEFDVTNYRRSLGLSQTDFAKEYGISVATLKKWEANSTRPVFGTSFRKMLDGWLRNQFDGLKSFEVLMKSKS